MKTLRFKLKTNRALKASCRFFCLVSLASALLLVSMPVHGQKKNPVIKDMAWPQFRRAGIKSCGNACAAGRTLVEDRERGVVACRSRARVVIANRDRR